MTDRTDRTPLPEPDRDAAVGFWERYVDTTGDPADPGFTYLGAFGDSVELAEELITLIIDGPKRATAGSLAEYAADGDAIPAVGDRWIGCDGRGLPRVLARTTEVRVGPLSSVDDAFAWDEGEGDRTRADWLRMHTDYFTGAFARLGETFHPDIPVAFERFEVLYTEPPS